MAGGIEMAPSPKKPVRPGTRRSSDRADRSSARCGPSQRDRLIDAMIELAASRGYQAVSIAHLSAHAGVSSATFYELFDGKEDCFVTAYRAAAERLFGQMGVVLAHADWSNRGSRRVLSQVIDALRDDPDAARLLTIESLRGGEQLRHERKRLIAVFEHLTQQFIDRAAPPGTVIDIPVVAVTGALRLVLARRLRAHAEHELHSLVEPSVGWLESYAVPSASGRWSAGPATTLAAPAGTLSKTLLAPATLPRGRHGLPAGAVTRSQRTRIIYGTAEVVMRKGYERTTVADIVSQAKVARDVFYEHFNDKEHAFLEAQHFPTQHILDNCATAYFSAAEWPERVWRFLYALIKMIYENPSVSHLRLVEAYAAGPTAIRRAEEITRSFTIFLEEGYYYSAQTRGLPRLWSQAIAGAIFEIIQRAAARSETDALFERLPQLTYIAIAPFTGVQTARQLIEQITSRNGTSQDEATESEALGQHVLEMQGLRPDTVSLGDE
jgi:AcrR family transcriptional regulator